MAVLLKDTPDGMGHAEAVDEGKDLDEVAVGNSSREDTAAELGIQRLMVQDLAVVLEVQISAAEVQKRPGEQGWAGLARVYGRRTWWWRSWRRFRRHWQWIGVYRRWSGFWRRGRRRWRR
ncbi:uncharacterized protein LY89DRAFT_725391 [Mollisia scopiformis]|uniref:Uncharacterized protein n=1 Tax=Mollisia scopiformis TaxID=149040 RepID=A0A132B6M6_MOLSC|nr:uncharacterized protein LY89DRAFT_725391 [Mollisia scopiformis]KUJ08062.1 hypothetical protein LY89DRAFT_725391 [Mollisia scopiformis]